MIPPVPRQLGNANAGWFTNAYRYLQELVAAIIADLGGGAVARITVANSPYTVPSGVSMVDVDPSGGPVLVVVPSALLTKTVVKYFGPTSNTITIEPDHGLIDGQPSLVMAVGWDCATTVGQGPGIGVYVTG